MAIAVVEELQVSQVDQLWVRLKGPAALLPEAAACMHSMGQAIDRLRACKMDDGRRPGGHSASIIPHAFTRIKTNNVVNRRRIGSATPHSSGPFCQGSCWHWPSLASWSGNTLGHRLVVL